MRKTITFVAAIALFYTAWAQGDTVKFVQLFNGKNLDNWMMLTNKPPAFAVVDGIIETRPVNGADLFTVKDYANYIFRFEYLLSKTGNSGVLIRCDRKNPWGTGVEVQLLAPWTPWRDDLHCTGSLYGYVAVTNRPDETTGVWHSMEIHCDRKIIKVSVDGKLTTYADIDKTPKLQSKWLGGAIGFQSNHGTKEEFAKFRNISVRDLDDSPDYVRAGFFDKDARVRTQAQQAAGALGSPMITPLVSVMDDTNVAARSCAKQTLFDIAAQATAAQTTPTARQSVVQALQNALQTNPSSTTTDYLKWLLNMVQSQ